MTKTIPVPSSPPALGLKLKLVHPNVPLPVRAYLNAAAFDLHAWLARPDGRFRTVTLGPGITQVVPTGLCLKPPPGYCVLVCSRSGLASNGIFVTNAPGVIDPDYTGEISCILTNAGMETQYVKHGDRIGQILIVPYLTPKLELVNELPSTERGEKGFGSTGA